MRSLKARSVRYVILPVFVPPYADDLTKGLYRSPFVLTPFSGHMDAIQGALTVSGLYQSESDSDPIGAVGLAAAAVRFPSSPTSMLSHC